MLIEQLLCSVKYEFIYHKTPYEEDELYRPYFHVQLISHDQVVATLFCGYLAERYAVNLVSEMQIFTDLESSVTFQKNIMIQS